MSLLQPYPHDGERAIEISEERDDPIDVLIADVCVPRIDGLGLMERLSDDRPNIKVLHMSGWGQILGRWWRS